jgi:DNA-3-methyladenine glycosylase II
LLYFRQVVTQIPIANYNDTMQSNIKSLQKEALSHLQKTDRIIAKLIDKIPSPEWHFTENYFIALVESIVSQQLSIKAADTIFGRLKNLTTDSELTAEVVLKMDGQRMRDAGLSWSKVSYVKNIAEYTLTSDTVFEKFASMSDEEIIAELTKIKGVGRWTAEMFLIFTMGRPDIFSYGDLGLRRAIQRLYGFDHDPKQHEIDPIMEKWKPYRSIASRYLWKSLELKDNT